jgi:hypothetical protein
MKTFGRHLTMHSIDFRSQRLSTKPYIAHTKGFQKIGIHESRGFAENVKRGTAYTTLTTTQQSVDRFLEANQLSFVIRGHEVVINGYRFVMNVKVITLFLEFSLLRTQK